MGNRLSLASKTRHSPWFLLTSSGFYGLCEVVIVIDTYCHHEMSNWFEGKKFIIIKQKLIYFLQVLFQKLCKEEAGKTLRYFSKVFWCRHACIDGEPTGTSAILSFSHLVQVLLSLLCCYSWHSGVGLTWFLGKRILQQLLSYSLQGEFWNNRDKTKYLLVVSEWDSRCCRGAGRCRWGTVRCSWVCFLAQHLHTCQGCWRGSLHRYVVQKI